MNDAWIGISGQQRNLKRWLELSSSIVVADFVVGLLLDFRQAEKFEGLVRIEFKCCRS